MNERTCRPHDEGATPREASVSQLFEHRRSEACASYAKGRTDYRLFNIAGTHVKVKRRAGFFVCKDLGDVRNALGVAHRSSSLPVGRIVPSPASTARASFAIDLAHLSVQRGYAS
jgi:hypothetical protein